VIGRAFAAAALAASLFAVAPAEAGAVRDRIYPAPTAPLSLDGLPAAARLASVRTGDGLTLEGIVLPARSGMPTLLVLHGNGSSAADAVRWLAPLAAAGYGIVAAEYRGYSRNPGRPDERGLAADADAFLALARAQAGDGPVWAFGHSLGGGVAVGLAIRSRVEALVTVGAFTRLRAMAPKLARAFVPDGYDNLAAVARLGAPWILIHGSADATVPLAEGRTLHRAAGIAGRRGAAVVLLDADHKPDAALLLGACEAARAWLRDGRWPTSELPASAKLIPFGDTRPLNP
jgi:pimeloyl-ACP methyl ester carboxylesterase